MNRRQFLVSASIATGAWAFADWKFNGFRTSEKRLLAFFTTNSLKPSPTQGLLAGGQVALHIVDVGGSDRYAFRLPMEAPHSLIQHPIRKEIVVIAPREKSRALVYDISKGEMIASLNLDRGRYFYGHGVFSVDGERLFLTGFDQKSNGFLLEYDAGWSHVRDIETFGKAPHDIRTCHGGDAVLIANNGWSRLSSYEEPSMTSVVMMDLKSKKLMEKTELPEGHIAFQHLAGNDRGDFLVGCDYYGKSRSDFGEYPSLLAKRSVGQKIEFLQMSREMREKMVGNVLSIAWDEAKDVAITTTPEGPVTFWNLREMKAEHQLLLGQHPHGVATTPDDVFVTTSNAGVWSAKRREAQASNFAPLDLPPFYNVMAHATWLS